MADDSLTAEPEEGTETVAAQAVATETVAKEPDPAAADQTEARGAAPAEQEATPATDSSRESLLPRLSRPGKVFSDGFKLPGFSGYTDLPGKVCIDCGFNAMKFSKQCPKCGGELVPEA